jgi:NAD(P)-dependent dehydrogenase (short-subunit alcohol dehydrogenase family)
MRLPARLTSAWISIKHRWRSPSLHLSNAALVGFSDCDWLPPAVGVDSCLQPPRGPMLILVACHRGQASAVEGGVRVGTSQRSRMAPDPDALAGAFVFLASRSKARGITGAIVTVDAGLTLRMPRRSWPASSGF